MQIYFQAFPETHVVSNKWHDLSTLLIDFINSWNLQWEDLGYFLEGYDLHLFNGNEELLMDQGTYTQGVYI